MDTNQNRKKIIAVDFDGTLCENQYPEIGSPNEDLIGYLLWEKKEHGAKLILWTNRCAEYLGDAVIWCRAQGLCFDAVNDNLPEVIEKFGHNSRKVFANLYIDDRNWVFTNLPFHPKKEGVM